MWDLCWGPHAVFGFFWGVPRPKTGLEIISKYTYYLYTDTESVETSLLPNTDKPYNQTRITYGLGPGACAHKAKLPGPELLK